MKRGPGRPAAPKEEFTFRLVVNNARETHAYVRLLDTGFEKDRVTIAAGEMDDPTIGHRLSWQEYMAHVLKAANKRLHVKQLFIWSPAVPQFLDLFTLHVYEDAGEDVFQNLRVYLSTLDPNQSLPDVIFWDVDFVLTEKTRMALVIPAFSTVAFDVTYTQ